MAALQGITLTIKADEF